MPNEAHAGCGLDYGVRVGCLCGHTWDLAICRDCDRWECPECGRETRVGWMFGRIVYVWMPPGWIPQLQISKPRRLSA